MRAYELDTDLRGRSRDQLDARNVIHEVAHERDVRRVVLDVDNLACRRARRQLRWARFRRGHWLGRRSIDGNVDPDRRASIRFAREPHRALHELGESLADREANAGAFDRARLLARALEWLEHLGAL